MSLLLKIVKDFDEHLKPYEFIIELDNGKTLYFYKSYFFSKYLIFDTF